MNSEKILVVYFSRSGKTKIIAREISQKLNCDLEEIKTLTTYSGFMGYQLALIQATFKITPKIRPLKKNIADYDLVIFGGPVWGGSLSGPIRTFIAQYKNNLKNVAFIATQEGKFGQKNVFEQMKKACGKTPLAILDITEKEFRSGTYRNSVTSFVSRLSLKNPKIAKRPLEGRRPEAEMRS